MKQYTEFSVNGVTHKAYHSLENLYRIEARGINLTELCIDSIDTPPSLTVTKQILEAALLADIQDEKKTREFVKQFIDAKRFIASNSVREFILSALTAPKDESGDTTEKKIVAS